MCVVGLGGGIEELSSQHRIHLTLSFLVTRAKGEM